MDLVKNKRATVLTYEYEKDTPWGFSIGKYKENKSNGYFTLRFNPELFEAVRSNNDSTKRPELNISFGWTIRVIKPYVWIFFGPGYTGVGKYTLDEKDTDKDDQLNLKIYSAISPEIGVLGKIKLTEKIGIALRYTFQYRFALDNTTTDYMGKTKHIVGVGLCF